MEQNPFLPLLETLHGIKSRLEQNNAWHLMVARPTLAAFKEQELPAHVQVRTKKRRGKRVSERGPRHMRLTRLVQARWPQDGQLEAAVPTLAYVMQGTADFHIADYLVQCQPGDLLFIPAGVAKPDAALPYVLDGSQRECVLLWIYPGPLNGVGLECFITHSTARKVRMGQQYGTSAIKHDFLVQLFNELNRQLLEGCPLATTRYLLTGLVLWLCREMEQGRAVIPWNRRLNQPVERSKDIVAEACKHIESHLNRHLTIDEMAQLLAVSPASFTRRFRAATGLSFNQYLTRQRLKGAQTLLEDTALPVNDVARYVGLTYERLRELFQQHHDCSPGEFRRRKI